LAAGKSNQEIADAMSLSVFTVLRHVSNIYTKTNAANRAEASAFAIRHGLAR
jgi:DNA-binding NarL/FixJ family response regulator